MPVRCWAQTTCRCELVSHVVAFLFQLETLQASYEDLKAQSQEEIRSLWSQLESARTNRQEPSGEEFPVKSSDPQKLKLCVSNC